MKVVVLNGSPRAKSNTMAAVHALLEGAAQALPTGALEVTEEDTTKSGVIACRGCGACQKSPGACVFDEAGTALAGRVVESDVLVVATPIYWWGMTAQLKTCIDKLYCKGAALAGPRKVVLVAVGGDGVEARQYALVEEQMQLICGYLGWELAGCYRRSASAAGELAADEAALAELRREGEQLAARLA